MSIESIVTSPFRLAFPEVFTPKASVEGGKEKYSITMLFPADGSQLIPTMLGEGVLVLRKLALAAVKEKWGDDRAKWPGNLRSLDFKTYVSPTGKDGWPIRDGNSVEWDGFEGQIFIRASSGFRPGVVSASLQAIISPEDIFGGLICRAQINAFTYDTNGNRGVTFGLNNLQVLKDDGTIFSGRQKAEEVFESFGESAGSSGSGDEDPFS
jgi:hypothetical protein